MILLLLLQINPTSASHASCLSIRTPVNFGALFLKFGSTDDHSSYNCVRFGERLRYLRIIDSDSSSSFGEPNLEEVAEDRGDKGRIISGRMVR